MSKAAPQRPTPEELAFLSTYDASAFPHPSVAVDVVVATAHKERLEVVLVQRQEHPSRGRWALPGGFVGVDESLDDAAARVLATKAGLEDVYLEQLYTFGRTDRDPRTRVISVAYYALVESERLAALREESEQRVLASLLVADAAGDMRETPGVSVSAPDGSVLPLAFDHADILRLFATRLRGKLDYTTVGFELLPEHFTLRRLQRVWETVLGRALNKDSFRRRLLATGQIAATGEREQNVLHRPAELYRFTGEPGSPL